MQSHCDWLMNRIWGCREREEPRYLGNLGLSTSLYRIRVPSEDSRSKSREHGRGEGRTQGAEEQQPRLFWRRALESQ